MSLKYKLAKRWKQIKAYFSFISQSKENTYDRRTVLICIKKIPPNRRLFQICSLLSESNYVCFGELSLSDFFSMDLYGLKAITQFKIQPCELHRKRNFDLIITDDEIKSNSAKTLRLDYSVFDDTRDYESGIFRPIHFHPDFMSVGTEKMTSSYTAEKKRNISIFFAGNCDKESYNSEETESFFHIHTRWDIFTFLEKNIPSDNVFCPSSYDVFCEARQRGDLREKIVLIDINKFKIPQSDWFGILGDADFFLQLPGYIQPWCHNQVESMSVGAIPITEFPHIFHPELKHRKNALTYTTKDELLLSLQQILQGHIPQSEIMSLRINVLNYYQKYFSFKSFSLALDDFIKSQETEKKLYICAGDFSLGENRNLHREGFI